MRRAVLWLLLLAAPARADVIIPSDCLVQNEAPGWCGWCCLEMLGRAQGVEALHGLKDARKKAGKYHGITEANARAQLKALGVHYRMQATGKRSTKLIRESLAAGRGVVVGVDLPKGKHAVIVTELTKAEARIVDPNEPTVGVVLPRYLFDQLWDGWALSILE